ncbi:hypothetical protein [Niveispirillum fermenti]|uniref:hypothetical protein n=1 Tax=Niveispirillum fermenti TaxID=1233113 RepID=UPI003A8C08CB
MNNASNAELISGHIRAALEAEPGSAAAISSAQQAIFYSVHETMKALQPALAPLLSPASLEEAEAIRNVWIAKLRFINGCLALPDLSDLSVALQELNRGVTAEALRPNGTMQGGKPSTERLRLMSLVVEAADELKRQCKKDAEYRAELNRSQTAHSTVEKYRKAIHGLPEFQPRMGWSIRWSEQPEIVLQHLVWAIKALDKR